MTKSNSLEDLEDLFELLLFELLLERRDEGDGEYDVWTFVCGPTGKICYNAVGIFACWNERFFFGGIALLVNCRY